MGFAAGHMLHAGVVAMFVMSSFAAIGVWRFGAVLPEFSTFETALATETGMLFAPDIIAGWEKGFELSVFMLLLLFAMVLLVLNFLLAIVSFVHTHTRTTYKCTYVYREREREREVKERECVCAHERVREGGREGGREISKTDQRLTRMYTCSSRLLNPTWRCARRLRSA